MATPPRFRPALLSLASVGLLVGYALLEDVARFHLSGYYGSEGLVLGLLAAAVAAPLVFIARVVARWRREVGGEDGFARFRRWAEARPRAARILLATPTLLALAVSYSDAFVRALRWEGSAYGLLDAMSLMDRIFWVLLAWIAPAVGAGLVGRALLRGFLLPVVHDAAAGGADAFTFSAVAVTPEARAAVAGVFALSVGVFAALGWLPQHIVYGTPGVAGLLGYIAVVVGGAMLFQRVSRIGLGFDGVLVTGSSRTRFYPYREIDEVEATRGGDVLLRRHGRVVLRLQLHGAHEGRHAAVAERIREGLLRAREPVGGGARRLAEARGAASLVHAALGQGSFRAPGVTRDELWELVEAPATAGASRAAAAGALAIGADGADRARLRFAAERCAEPAARAALARSAAADEAAEEEAAASLAAGVRKAKNA